MRCRLILKAEMQRFALYSSVFFSVSLSLSPCLFLSFVSGLPTVLCCVFLYSIISPSINRFITGASA